MRRSRKSAMRRNASNSIRLKRTRTEWNATVRRRLRGRAAASSGVLVSPSVAIVPQALKLGPSDSKRAPPSHRLADALGHLLRVAEQHPGVVAIEQRIVYAGV